MPNGLCKECLYYRQIRKEKGLCGVIYPGTTVKVKSKYRCHKFEIKKLRYSSEGKDRSYFEEYRVLI